MGTFRLIGKDTIKINNRLINDLADGEVCSVKFPTEMVTVKTGKNSNAIFSRNYTGDQADMELKVLRGSDDDKFLNSLKTTYQNDPTGFVLLSAELVKRLGDGQGNETADTLILTGGVFTKHVEVVSEVSGNTDQAIAVYGMKFAVAPRAIV